MKSEALGVRHGAAAPAVPIPISGIVARHFVEEKEAPHVPHTPLPSPSLTRPHEVRMENKTAEPSFMNRVRSWFSDAVGIDLGTKNTVVHVRGRGIVLREPTVVALKGDNVIAVGSEAARMIGKTPPSIRTVRPLRDGVVADFDVCREMIRHFIRTARPSNLTSPRVVVAIPAGVTEVERRAVREAVLQAGASKVYLIDEALAAAVGAKMRVEEPEGTFLISIGSGTTQAVVMSIAETVVFKVSPVAGDAIDKSIMDYLLEKHRFTVSERVAEEIKIKIGSAITGQESATQMEVGGQTENGLPASLSITAEEIRHAMEPALQTIIGTVREALEACPADLASDIIAKGLIMVGGGALLRGLDKRIAQETGIKVTVVNDPMSVTAMGAGFYLETLAEAPEEQ